MHTIISGKMLSEIPEDFDWQFYLSNHPDLLNANITTESQAIQHYLYHGRYENRLYTRIPTLAQNISFANNHEIGTSRIVLSIQIYECNDAQVQQNNLECLSKNLNNTYIDIICVFLEKESDRLLIPENIRDNPKIHLHYCYDRLSYKIWMKTVDKQYKSYIKILANSDIYFDNTLRYVLSEQFNNMTMYAITRKDLDENNIITQSHDYYNDKRYPTNPHYSHDVWIYQQPLVSMQHELADMDLKLGIGNCDRIFKQTLEDNDIIFINLYSKVNAIHLDKRTDRGDRESYDLQKYGITPINQYNFNDSLEYKNLQKFNNKLENIWLLLNNKNELNEKLDSFLQKIMDTNSATNKSYAKDITFNVYTQHDIESSRFDDLRSMFKSVNINHTHIPTIYDHYDNPVPNKYGYRSGPNYAFFESMRLCKKYNTSLFLETDVFFDKDWLQKLSDYCQTNTFWISGAMNDNYHLQSSRSIHSEHINGGVCLYNTGNSNFQSFIDFCDRICPYYVEKKLNGIPYDYLLIWVIKDFYNYDHKNRNLWQYINRQYQFNNLIYNYSTDTNITLESINTKYNFALVHKK
jgi:hypothetical protein